MLRTFCSLLILCFALKHSEAQVQLKLLSEVDGQPVIFAPVKWKVINSGQVLQSQTNDAGVINILTGGSPVSVTIAYLGYELIKDTVFIDGQYTLILKPDLKYLPEAVVTDQYTAVTPEKSIHKIMVIDAVKIRNMGAVNLNDVLGNQLNIRLNQDNLLGSSMSVMGISGQNVKILLDGIPVIGRQNGNIDLSQINLNNVERIEIIEGPLSVAYGTNALAGAINIITKKKAQHKVDLDPGVYYESSGKYNVTLNAGLRKQNGVYNFSGGRNYFDGWSSVSQPRFQEWKPKEQYFGRFQYLRKIGLFDLTIKTELLNEKITNKGLPRLPYMETAFDEYYLTRRFDNSVTATSKLPKNRYLNLMVAHNEYTRIKNRYLFNRVTLEKDLVPEPNEQDTTRFSSTVLRGTYTKALSSALLNYQIGYDINLDQGFGRKISGKNASLSDYATFISMELRLKTNWTLKPGVRYSYNTSYKTIPLPSLNIKWASQNGLAFRSSYARGFRAPDLKELYLYFVDVNHNITGNPDLKSETSHNVQMSLVKKAKIGKTMIQPELAVNYNTISDRIILTNVRDLNYTYKNLDHFRSLNTNLSLTWQFSNLKLNAGYAGNAIYTSASGFSDPVITHEFTGNLSHTLTKHHFTTSLFVKAVNNTPVFILNEIGQAGQVVMDGYTWIDVSCSKSFRSDRWALVAGIKNLTGLTSLQTTGNGGGIHSTGSSTQLFATGRTFFLSLNHHLYYN